MLQSHSHAGSIPHNNIIVWTLSMVTDWGGGGGELNSLSVPSQACNPLTRVNVIRLEELMWNMDRFQ